MKRLFILSAVFILLLVSCSTLSNSLSIPSWVTEPPYVAFSTVFVGEGEGSTPEEAKTNSVLSVLSEMGDEIGINYEDEYFHELYTTGSIEKLSTVTSAEYSTEDSEGVWHFYILTVSNTSILNEARSEDYTKRLERESRLRAKVEESLDYYRNNQDIRAVDALLEAVAITLEGETNIEEYSTSALVERIEKYISQIEFTFLGKTRATDWNDGFRIMRNKGIMHSAVEDASVEITYPSLDTEENIILLPYKAKSNSRGIVSVNKTNAYALRKGTYTIRIVLDEDVISSIDEAAGEELLSHMKELVEEVSCTAEYSDVTSENGIDDAAVALLLYGYDGAEKDITEARQIISEMCSSLSLSPITVIEAEGEDEEEALEYLRTEYSDTAVIYMVRIGVVDRVHTLGLWYSRTEGNVVRIDNTKGTSEEYKTMQYVTVTDGDTPDEEEALENQIRLTLSYVLGEF